MFIVVAVGEVLVAELLAECILSSSRTEVENVPIRMNGE